MLPRHLDQEDDEHVNPSNIPFKESKADEQSEMCFPADDPEKAESTELGKELDSPDQSVIGKIKSQALLYFEVWLPVTVYVYTSIDLRLDN